MYVDMYDAAADCRRADRGGWSVHLARAPVASLKARWVVDATGRPAWLARRQGARRRCVDRLVGLMGFANSSAHEPRTLLESWPAGWWYAAVLPGRPVGAAYFTDAGLPARGSRPRDTPWKDGAT